MSSDIAIHVVEASKHYQMYKAPADRLKQMLVPRVQAVFGVPQKRYFESFSAVQPVSFDVHRGQTLGIIGRNGSGKSTLLQMICGTLRPSSGSIQVNGRIAALLELGAGFNPEFTGRENVKLNCAILGLTPQETEDRFDAIERFADIGMFIDQPVKTYSSGMYVRLAFAVAINADPDILVVDEALAVGDEAFQRKCYARIEQIREQGATILFVSHGAQTIIQLCDRALLMDRGEILMDGSPKRVVQQYQRLINLSGDEAESVRQELLTASESLQQSSVQTSNEDPNSANASEDGGSEISSEGAGSNDDAAWFDPSLVSPARLDYESQGAIISDAKITTPDGRQVNVVQSGAKYAYQYTVTFTRRLQKVGFGALLNTNSGLGIAGFNAYEGHRLKQVEEGSQFIVNMEFECRLLPGSYFLNAGVVGESEDEETKYVARILDLLHFKVLSTDRFNQSGIVDLRFKQSLLEQSDAIRRSIA